MEEDYSHEASSTPIKLPLHNSFPCKRYEPAGMQTPPLRTLASVPFGWEDAPGKPRATTDNEVVLPAGIPALKSKTVRCLVPPPPRLITNCKITNMPSPTAVLDGPYSGRISSSKSFSLGHSVKGTSTLGRREGKDRFSFSSLRWGSYRDQSSASEGSMDFSSGVGDYRGESSDRKVGMTRRIRRRSSSFLSLSSTSTNLLSIMYASFKQAVPWKRRPEKLMRKMSL